MKFCIYCGYELPNSAEFCFKCGKRQPNHFPDEALVDEKEAKIDTNETVFDIIKESSSTEEAVKEVKTSKLEDQNKDSLLAFLKKSRNAASDVPNLQARLQKAEERFKQIENNTFPEPDTGRWDKLIKVGIGGLCAFLIGLLLLIVFDNSIIYIVVVVGFFVSLLLVGASIFKSSEIKDHNNRYEQWTNECSNLEKEIKECKSKLALYNIDAIYKKIPSQDFDVHTISKCIELIRNDKASSIKEALDIYHSNMMNEEKENEQTDSRSELKTASNKLLRLSGRRITVTNESLTQYMIDGPICFRMFKVEQGFENELNFATDFSKSLITRFSETNIEAQFSMDEALSGNVRHPLLRIHHEEYGDIGVMFNKNIVFIVRLSYGLVTKSMMEQSRLNNVANHYDQRQVSSFSNGGVGGFVGGIGNGVMAGNAKRAANKISYDPTEIVFEQDWERNVIECINNVFK